MVRRRVVAYLLTLVVAGRPRFTPLQCLHRVETSRRAPGRRRQLLRAAPRYRITTPSPGASRSDGRDGMRKRARPDASPAADHSIWQGPHELWLSAASVLARVLRNGSLKSILAPMRSEQARPINALVTETLKRRDILERLVDQCGPWKEDSAHELRLLLAHEALFGRGLHQSALQRATEDAALSEALERLRAWETKALKAAKAAAREAGTMPAGATAPEPELSEVVCKLPRYARVNTLKATQDAVVATLAAEGWTLIDPPVPPTDSASHRGGVSSCGP